MKIWDVIYEAENLTTQLAKDNHLVEFFAGHGLPIQDMVYRETRVKVVDNPGDEKI